MLIVKLHTHSVPLWEEEVPFDPKLIVHHNIKSQGKVKGKDH